MFVGKKFPRYIDFNRLKMSNGKCFLENLSTNGKVLIQVVNGIKWVRCPLLLENVVPDSSSGYKYFLPLTLKRSVCTIFFVSRLLRFPEFIFKASCNLRSCNNKINDIYIFYYLKMYDEKIDRNLPDYYYYCHYCYCCY